MQEKQGEKKTLREIILGGTLLPFSVRMRIAIRKGDLFQLPLNKDGEIIKDGSEPYWSSWYRVTSTASLIEMKSAVIKPGGEFTMPLGLKESILVRKAGSANLMAFLIGCPSASQQAEKLNLRIPPTPIEATKKPGELI
ncbi:MAG TPA: hypothetical protein VH595_08520 [Verrucomicrobiae bacterium]|jgi:hypothetical protein|nr:hypothetical protein [Verrucomicrobiae bacterium]